VFLRGLDEVDAKRPYKEVTLKIKEKGEESENKLK